MLAASLASDARAQSAGGGSSTTGTSNYHAFAWVDPVNGVDATASFGDPDAPFKTLQLAIDTVWAHLHDYNSDPNNDLLTEGTVYAQPGVYGPASSPNGLNSSGDTFPITLRDRVHVKGVGARRCILRGIDNAPGVNAFWPPDRPAA